MLLDVFAHGILVWLVLFEKLQQMALGKKGWVEPEGRKRQTVTLQPNTVLVDGQGRQFCKSCIDTVSNTIDSHHTCSKVSTCLDWERKKKRKREEERRKRGERGKKKKRFTGRGKVVVCLPICLLISGANSF